MGQPRLLLLRETGHVGAAQNIGAVLVITAVRNRDADLVQHRRPTQKARVVFVLRTTRVEQLPEQFERRRLDALRLASIDLIAPAELAHRRLAHIVMVKAPDQVVEHAQAQRAAGISHALDTELGKHRAQDRQPARQHRQTVGRQPLERHRRRRPRANHQGAQGLQAVPGDSS